MCVCSVWFGYVINYLVHWTLRIIILCSRKGPHKITDPCLSISINDACMPCTRTHIQLLEIWSVIILFIEHFLVLKLVHIMEGV